MLNELLAGGIRPDPCEHKWASARDGVRRKSRGKIHPGRFTSGDESFRYWRVAQCLAQDRPMHRLVAENTAGGFCQVAIGE